MNIEINNQNRDALKTEFLSQPVLGMVVGELAKKVELDPILKDRLRWIGISGSKARQAEIDGVNGVVSDDDLVVLMGDAGRDDPLNIEAYNKVLDGINAATKRLIEEKNIIPVYASTIRLEDAQMAIAKLVKGGGGNLRIVHSLIYPSPEAVLAFEPPILARNLFGQSLGLWGDDSEAKKVAQMAREGVEIDNPNLTIGGLDAISDNYRMIRTNRHILPPVFLGPQAVHVLDYSFKWAMAAVVERESGFECGTWGQIIEHFPSDNGGAELVALMKETRRLRAQEDQVNIDEVEQLYNRVIKLWPTFTNFRK